MLISHEYQFIFIKTRKTAGTSIEISLSRFLGPWDVITPISPEDELARIERGIVPRNYINFVHPVGTVSHWDEKAIRSMQSKVNMVRQFYNHCPATEIRKSVGERIWNSYYKFCFERNPWERVVSEYYYVLSKNPQWQGVVSLESYIRERRFSLNHQLYMEDGEPVVDRICRFESLQEDLTDVCQRLNIPYDGWLPRAKSGLKKASAGQKDILTAELVDIIAQACQPEIELLGYSARNAA